MSICLRSLIGFASCLALLLVSSTLAGQEAPGGPPGEDAAPARPTRNRTPNSKFSRMSTAVGQSGSKSSYTDLLETEDLSQFRGYKEEAIGDGWSVDGKYLHFDGSGGGDIVTKEKYKNFDLKFDWKVTEGGNSGVMYRVSLGDGAPYLSGPEFQVLDDTKHKDGQSALTSAGSLYGLYPPMKSKPRRAGVWNKGRILVRGNKISHFVNGKKVVEAELDSGDWRKRVSGSKFKAWEKFGKNPEGHIAFQDHGDEVWYRNIMIKSLDDESGDAAESRPKRSSSNKFKGMMQSGPGVPSEEPGGGSSSKQTSRKSSRKSSSSKFSRMRAGGAPGAPKEEDKGKKKDDDDGR